MSGIRIHPLNQLTARSSPTDVSVLVVSEDASAEDAGTVRESMGIETSIGGNGAADSGKYAVFGEAGELEIGGPLATSPAKGMLHVTCLNGTTIQAVNLAVGGVAFEAGMPVQGSIGYSVHLGPQSGQVGFSIDGSGGVASGVGYYSNMPGVAFIAADAESKETVSINSGNADAAGGWVAWSTSGDRGANEIRLKGQTPSSTQVATLPDQTGYVALVPPYADLTAANAALASGDFFWDTTLKKLRQATA